MILAVIAEIHVCVRIVGPIPAKTPPHMLVVLVIRWDRIEPEWDCVPETAIKMPVPVGPVPGARPMDLGPKIMSMRAGPVSMTMDQRAVPMRVLHLGHH